MTDRTIAVDYLARVEGEGSLKVRLEGRTVKEVHLSIFEPPRYFEALLQGRTYDEAPDITARICGICPVAYQMSACHAMERAMGLTLPAPLRALRRLLYCGEWIESHTLHMYLLHAPDFFGVPDALALAKVDVDVVRRGLALKQAGNTILEAVGGRAVHPVNVRVGGFYRVPSVAEAEALRAKVAAALPLARATVRWATGLPYPELEEPYEFVALRPADEYPMNEGPIASSAGLELPQERFAEAFDELQVPHSNSFQVVRRGGGSYLVGPLARYALNRDRLGPEARAAAQEAGLEAVVRNPFRSLLVRAVEVVHACEEALRILAAYKPPAEAFVPPTGRFDRGPAAAVTEAPRGMLYHHYDLAPDGKIRRATIIAPTTQNQKRIEDDVRHVVERSLDLPDAALTDLCERAIRNHDPCISCATHFLNLEVERG